jgi:HAD superfamily hydrolase (TIGR01549 family)
VKYQAVLFDLDDTLVKTHLVKWAHHKAVAKKFYNIDLTDEVIREHWGKPFEPMMAIFYQNADTPANMLAANLSLEDQYLKELQEDALDAVDTLLAARVEIGIITSITGALAKKDLLRLGFPVEKFFLLQGSDDEPAHKPDPKVFDKALRLLEAKKISKDEVVYIGDALMDYYAARDAGIGFIGITTGLASEDEFMHEGAATVPSLADLLLVLDDTTREFEFLQTSQF